jgi:hypothetical protein
MQGYDSKTGVLGNCVCLSGPDATAELRDRDPTDYWRDSRLQFWLFTPYDKDEMADLTAPQRKTL